MHHYRVPPLLQLTLPWTMLCDIQEHKSTHTRAHTHAHAHARTHTYTHIAHTKGMPEWAKLAFPLLAAHIPLSIMQCIYGTFST